LFLLYVYALQLNLEHVLQGFFTYLYGTSILFLLYVFCFLLQESACCTAGDTTSAPPRPPPPPPANKKKSKDKEKEKEKAKEKEKEKKAGGQQQQGQEAKGQAAARNKGGVFQVGYAAPGFRLGGWVNALQGQVNILVYVGYRWSSLWYVTRNICVTTVMCGKWGIMLLSLLQFQ
jgi:hypothetical protein